jgi:putative redox protein
MTHDDINTERPALQPGEVLVRDFGAGFMNEVFTASHKMVADEPVTAGGTDRGPDPYGLLLAALGACTSMTLRLYAQHKQLPLRRVSVKLRHSKIYAQDCDDCDTREGKLDQIEREITIEGDLDGDQRERLLEIANRCPVHRTLTSEIRIRSRLVE